MIKKLSILCMLILFCGSVAWGDSASNRKDQTVRLGMKSGIHIMYLYAAPFVVDMPGEDRIFGLVYGSGNYSYSYIDTSSSGSTTKTLGVNFSTQEVTGRYYIGNSFNIPFGYANYQIAWKDYIYYGATYDITYDVTQLNICIGNEWTYD